MYIIILSILISLFNFYMGFYAYFNQKNALSNRIFLLMTILFSGWGLSGAFFNTMNIHQFATVWMLTSYVIWTLGTALILQFCLSLKEDNGHLKPITLAVLYTPAIIMLLGMIAFNGLIPSNQIYETPLKIVFGIPGGMGFYCLYTAISVAQLVNMGKKSNDFRIKRQSQLISSALVITSLLTAVYGFILPPLVSKPLPVLLPFFPTIWIVSMWISITKYGFLTLTMEVATKKILDNIQEIIILTDHKCIIVDVNKKFEETVQVKKGDIKGKSLYEVLSKNEALLHQVERVLKSEVPFFLGDVEFCYGSEQCLPIRIHISSIVDHLSHNIGVIIAANDLTLEKEYERLSITDSLTNAYNRMKIERIIKRLIQDRKQFSIILFDLDFFKKVNDTFGHATGDHVLISIVDVVNQELRALDFMGRWGGEEFIIVLPDTTETIAFQISERIRITTSEYDFGLNKSVTISLGISGYEGSNRTLAELVNCADEALYEAKHTGRNKTVLHSDIKKDMNEE